MITIYAAMENKDQTEGRGPMIVIAYFDSDIEAAKYVKGKGVMGVGDGQVDEVTVFTTTEEIKANKSLSKSRMVYGYRQDWRGLWGYGWVDNRDAPINDPEYQDYIRLRKKFEEGS